MFRKILQKAGIIFLLLLALIGVSIAGGIPVPLCKKKEDSNEELIEMVDLEEDEEQ
jgi:hypothetical protein